MPRIWFSLPNRRYDGFAVARGAADAARKRSLDASQRARLDLVDALIAGGEQRYDEAAALFEKAAPRLDARRRAMALYGGYYSRALADPKRVEQPPSVGDAGPYGALAEAWTVGFLRDLKSAIEVLRRAETRYPGDPTLPAARAQLALLLDDRDQVEEALGRALSLDPDDPMALNARANYLADRKGDLEGAYSDLLRATELAPGASNVWNTMGLVQRGRGASREAEAAIHRAIELSPHDPVYLVNLAFIYLDDDRLEEAKALIDRALAADPSYDIALVARGRYHLQKGELDRARDDLLAGSTANPAFAQALLLLSAGYYETGELEASAQAVENADRLDPNDPVTTSFRAAIAIDDYDADSAIRFAQETLRRTRGRGGDFAALSANRDSGSILNSAYRLAGLDAWGRYYGEAVFDPFTATGYFDQAVSGSTVPFVTGLDAGSAYVDPIGNGDNFSALMQGLLLDPAAISGRSRSANLLRRPFNEGSIGGGFTHGSDTGWTGTAELQGFVLDPVPWSYYAQFSGQQVSDQRSVYLPGLVGPNRVFSLGDDDLSGIGYLTARPTPYDRVVAFANIQRDVDRFDDSVGVPGFARIEDRDGSALAATAGLAWSHTFSHRNILNAGVFATESSAKSRSIEDIADTATWDHIETDSRSSRRSYIGALSHSFAVGDVTLRYGIEAGEARTDDRISIWANQVAPVPTFDPPATFEDRTSSMLARGHFDALWEVSPTFSVEAGIYPTSLSGDIDVARLDPRFAVAWAPIEGHWLRAGYISRTEVASEATLAPIGVLGLQANQTPLSVGGHAETAMARWDAEWTNRLFTSIEYQHQELRDASITNPGAVATLDFERARLDRLSGTANLWLGYGFGATATLAYTKSRDDDPASPGFGGALPFVPEISGRVGLTWVNPANVKATLAATYIGERESGVAGFKLDDFWTVDAFLTWEPFDKRFALELSGYNLLDESFDIGFTTPGWGRTFTGSLKVRF